MTKFHVILEDGTLFKGVFIKMGSKFAKTNAELYWYTRTHQTIEIYRNEKTLIGEIDIKDIYYFTTSKNY